MGNFVPVGESAILEGIVAIALDSPANRNALSQQLLTELRPTLDRVAEIPDTRGVLLRSSQRVFSSGADLPEASTVPMDVAARSVLSTLPRNLINEPERLGSKI